MRFRLRTLLIVFLLLALSASWWRGANRNPEPVEGEYLNQRMAAIRDRFGPPSDEWEGHYGNRTDEYIKKHDPSVTMIYVRSAGTLYLSFERVNGEWVCYSSHWMPKGTVF